MNKVSLVLFLALAGLSAGALGAWGQQPDQVPPPKEPILPRAAAQADWTILYCYDREKALAELAQKGEIDPSSQTTKEKLPYPRPNQVEISKDNATYGEHATWSDGRVQEKWVKDGLQLYDLPSSGKIARVLLRYVSPDFSDYTRSDFENLEWIGKDVYVGSKKLGDRVVYVFSVPASKKRLTPREIAMRTQFGGSHAAQGAVLTAYLDAQTQLPVAFDDGEMVYFYRFAPSAGALTVPDKFSKEFDAWKLELQQNQHHSGQS